MFRGLKRKRKPKRRVKPRVKREQELTPRQRELRRELAGVLFLGLAALTFISLAVQESGAFGMSVRRYFTAFAGEMGAYFLPLIIAAVGWQMIKRPQKVTFSSRFCSISTRFCSSRRSVSSWVSPGPRRPMAPPR